MRYIVIISLLFSFAILHSSIVAKVGNIQITSEELLKEMQNYEGEFEFTYGQIRELALEDLVNKKVIFQYAKKKNITVNNFEIEAFFMQQLGEHPRFQTDEQFDNNKFELFKMTKRGRFILKEMKEELLLNKTKTLISESFEITSKSIFKNYFSENTKVDLGYALVDIDDANVPLDISLNQARNYYLNEKDRFLEIEKVKLEFFIVFNEDFIDTVKPIVEQNLQIAFENDSTLTINDLATLRAEYQKIESTNLCRKKILQLKEIWKETKLIKYPIIATAYLSKQDQLGKLPSEIIDRSLQMDKGDYSNPINIGSGYLVFRLVDKQKFHRIDELAVANDVWQEYISKEANIKREYAEYFKNNIDEFIVPAAVVKIIEITSPSIFSFTDKKKYISSIQDSLSKYAFDENGLQNIVKEYNLKTYNSVLFLEKFNNHQDIDDDIAYLVQRKQYQGFLPSDNKIIYYQLNSYFPDYIPDFNKIRSQLYKFIDITKYDSIDYQRYYDMHQKDFSIPDSIQLMGAFFPFDEIETVVSTDSLFQKIEFEYQENIEDQYRENSVKFDYIFTDSKETAEIIIQQVNSNINFSFLDYCFGKVIKLPKNKIVELSRLPSVISEELSSLKTLELSEPLQYQNGWIILKPIKIYPSGIIPFSELKFELFQKEMQKIKRSAAFEDAKTVFDSTRYFSQLHKFVNEDNIFKTAFQNAEEDFNVIGSIEKYEKDILRIWQGEKFSQLFETESGYAILFLTKRKASEKLAFQDALPRIKEAMNAKKRFETAKAFVSEFRTRIIAGADPEYQLFFFGGWHRIQDLKLNEKIPNIEYSDAILDDIIRRNSGYYSPIFPMQKDKILFYHIYDLQQPTEEEFNEIKDDYREKLINADFEKWLDQEKALLKIEKY